MEDEFMTVLTSYSLQYLKLFIFMQDCNKSLAVFRANVVPFKAADVEKRIIILHYCTLNT